MRFGHAVLSGTIPKNPIDLLVQLLHNTGILKRHGKVYTKVIPNASSATLMPIITHKIRPDSVVYTDCWAAYNALDVNQFHHFRINHSKLFADRNNHINPVLSACPFGEAQDRIAGSRRGYPERQFPAIAQRM